MSIKERIIARMSSGEPFTFFHLWMSCGGGDSYRAADAMIQKWQRKGYISFRREGRSCIWSLTPEGQEYVESLASR